MSYRNTPSNREEISRCQLTASRRFNVSLKVYKSLKAATQLIAVSAGFYAMAIGTDPGLVYPLMVAVLIGPEALEYTWANGSAESSTNE
jgi:hypothetical protein